MNLDRYIEFIGEFLQLAFPQTHGRTIAATAIRGNEQTLCQRITNAAYVLPLAANGLHGEGRRIVVDPDVHPARVGAKIINSIRCGAAEFLDQKVVHTNLFRVALGALFAAGVLEGAHEFLLLRVDGEHRLVLGQGHPDRLVDEAELSLRGLNCRRLPWSCDWLAG
jgi:ribosomal protein S18 acetylase RimI-like enzyme